jgi:LPS-assembly lipoprotein
MWLVEMRVHRSSTGPLVRFLCAAAVLLLAACGFHPRGDTPLPAEMAVTYIQGTQEFDTLYDDFRIALESRGARVTQDRAEATSVLAILHAKSGTDVQSVDLNGKVLEYRLSRTIQIELTTADGRLLIDPQTITQSRVIKFNVNGLLGSEREGEAIRAELQRDVVNLAMLRIAVSGGR